MAGLDCHASTELVAAMKFCSVEGKGYKKVRVREVVRVFFVNPHTPLDRIREGRDQ